MNSTTFVSEHLETTTVRARISVHVSKTVNQQLYEKVNNDRKKKRKEKKPIWTFGAEAGGFFQLSTASVLSIVLDASFASGLSHFETLAWVTHSTSTLMQLHVPFLSKRLASQLGTTQMNK